MIVKLSESVEEDMDEASEDEEANDKEVYFQVGVSEDEEMEETDGLNNDHDYDEIIPPNEIMVLEEKHLYKPLDNIKEMPIIDKTEQIFFSNGEIVLENENAIKVDTNIGAKFVPTQFVKIQSSGGNKEVSIQTKSGKSFPITLKAVNVVFTDVKKKDSKNVRPLFVDSNNKIYEKIPKKKNLHNCKTCARKFNNAEELKIHKSQIACERFDCLQCDKSFAKDFYLKRHQVSHESGDKVSFGCDICGMALNTKRVLKVHMLRHTGEYTHTCEICDKGFYSFTTKTHHLESVHQGIRYECKICGSVIKSKRYYKEHMSNHETGNACTYECTVCHKFYSTKSTLNAHKLTHLSRAFICTVCGRKCVTKPQLNEHLKLHTGIRGFNCNICSMSFRRKDGLKNHLRKTHDIYKYPCEICADIFNSEYKLQLHYQSHEDVEKPFKCAFCDESFILKKFLRTHINNKHVDTPEDLVKEDALPRVKGDYECSECDFSFVTLRALKTHLKRHKMRHAEETNTEGDANEEVEEMDQEYAEHVNDEINSVEEEEVNLYDSDEEYIERETPQFDVYVGTEAIAQTMSPAMGD